MVIAHARLPALTSSLFLYKAQSMGTIRQQIIDLLEQEAMTALSISRVVGAAEKDVYRHLTHIRKSLSGRGKKLSFTPSSCLGCGFTFTDRHRLTRPGRCPKCRQSRISHPLFKIE
jgi:predicted Zn-ribbon and HTH transcriptional regulator